MVEKVDSYLVVEDLVTRFFTSRGIVKAIDSVSFSIKKGEIFGLVGESGCGKSVTALSVMDLVPDPPGRIVGGKIYIDGFNILGDLNKLASIRVKNETNVKIKRNKRYIKRHNAMLSRIRGKKAGMIFQEPSLALNPVLSVADQITENILLHNRTAIADSLLRRANLKTDDIDKLIQGALREKDNVKGFLNRWCRTNALPEIEGALNQIFSNYYDINQIKDEVIKLIRGQQEYIDLAKLSRSRDFFKLQDDILDAQLRLISAEESNDEEKKRSIEAELRSLKAAYGTKYLSFRIQRFFLKKRMDRVFIDESLRRAKEMLTLVNLSDPDRILKSYPHELSGGMQQRVMIAIALASNPRLLIADEPTTALDVTTQAQILDLIRSLNEVLGMSVLFITHDLAVIAEMCQRVAVMYAGNIVEEAQVNEIYSNPKHPYTAGLLAAIPKPNIDQSGNKKLDTIPGSVPNLIKPPSGCRFHPRCKFKMDICEVKKPKLVDVGDGHKVACFLFSSETVEAA
ncbi:MAG: ABC transporter ATP-binding protein [Thermoplasmataceae archaeon]